MGQRSGPVPAKLMHEQRLERIQNRAGRRILGVSWRFHADDGVVVRGELGWRKLKYDRHSLALQYVGRLRGMGVGEVAKKSGGGLE